MKIKNKTTGFTLIELMVAMVVIGIGLAVTVPAMMNFTNANRKSEQVNKLVRSLAYAKSEAVNRGEAVCVSSTSTTAVWDGGWAVFDLATATILNNATTIAVTGESITSSSGATRVCYRASGAVSVNAASYAAVGALGLPAAPVPVLPITIEQCSTNVCVNQLNREKQLTISATGRVNLNIQFACLPAKAICP